MVQFDGLVVIPARGGSKGVARKNLRELHGLPLTTWTLRFVSKMQVSQAFLSSDDDQILSLADEFETIQALRRPPKQSSDMATDQEVLMHAVEAVGDKIDKVMMLQPTAPSRQLELVRQCVTIMSESDASAVWSVSPVESKLNALKQLRLDSSGDLKLMQPSPKPFRRQDLPQGYIRNGECYIIALETLFSDPNLLGPHAKLVESSGQPVNIDSLEDFELAENYLIESKEGLLEPRY